MKILLAEDDDNIATIAKLTLESVGGHEVTHVSNGEAALQMALSKKWDLILLDEMMPKMSGHKVCESYKAKAKPSADVIIMSANPQTSELLNKIGAIGSIAKPFDPMSLNSDIEKLIQSNLKKVI